MTLGPGSYGRYNDDPTHVGCPRARTDMTPCVARDGSVAETTITALDAGYCVGCSENPADLLRDLVWEVTSPATE